MTNRAYLEPEDIERMEQTATSLRDRLLIRVLFHLGCRISEALAITIDNINLENSLVTIVHLKVRSKLLCPGCECRLSKSHSYCPGCGKSIDQVLRRDNENCKFRTLPVDLGTLSLLKGYIEGGIPVTKNGKRYIFRINRHRAWQIVRDCANRAGLPSLVNPETGKIHNVSPHRLRDAFAVHVVKTNDSGDGLRLLQEHLGHTSFNTTARYRKVAGEEHRRWYDNLWQNPSG